MVIGKVLELWRYPVKSLGGERLGNATAHLNGFCGDRSWALVDATTGDITGAKRYPKLLQVNASYEEYSPAEWVYGEDVPGAKLEFIDGTILSTSSSDVNRALSELVGTGVVLHPLRPPEDVAHYRLSKPTTKKEFVKMMNVKSGEDIPDFSETDQDLLNVLLEHATPPGKYVDAYPLHLLTTASLKKLSSLTNGEGDLRRFRPNILVEPLENTDSFLEFSWVGKELQIGSTVLYIDSRTVRCAMPAREQPQYGLGAAPEVSKALYKNTNRNLGVNVTVVKPGEISVGDKLILIN